MILVAVLVCLGVLFGIAAVVSGRGGSMHPAEPDALDTRIPPPDVQMEAPDVDSLRFGLAFRGYRMDQVDDALDRLRDELQARDEQLAALTGGRVPARSTTPAPAPTPAPPSPTPTPPGPPPMPTPPGPPEPTGPTEPAPTPPAPPDPAGAADGISKLRRRSAQHR